MKMTDFTPTKESVELLEGGLTRDDLNEIINANLYADAVARGATPDKPRRDASQLLTIYRLAHLLGVDPLQMMQTGGCSQN